MSGSHLIPDTEEELEAAGLTPGAAILDEATQEELVEAEAILENDEVELSAKTIHILFQHFRKVGYKLADRKKKAPIRVLEALLFDGLEDVELVGKEELNLLDIAKQIMYHKGVLIEYALTRKQGEDSE